MSFAAGGDLCLGFWARCWDAGLVPLPQGARVIEIGCAEADWLTPMQAERPDLVLTGVDWRHVTAKAGMRIIRGDVLALDFPSASFDAVVAVSAIEHIGLGAYDNDPRDADGDTHCMERVREWLVPGGLVYLDVPYRPDGPHTTNGNFRAYAPDTLSRLIVPGLVEQARYLVSDSGHGDGPYLALVLRKDT